MWKLEDITLADGYLFRDEEFVQQVTSDCLHSLQSFWSGGKNKKTRRNCKINL